MDLLMTKLELSKLYGVSRPTFSKRIAALGFEKGRRKFSAQEVEQIMEFLGPPEKKRAQEVRQKIENPSTDQEPETTKLDERLEEVLMLYEQLSSTDQALLLKLIRTWCAFRFTNA